MKVQEKFKPPSEIITSISTILPQVSYYVSGDERCGIKISQSRNNEEELPWIARVYVRQKLLCQASFITKTRAVTISKCFGDGVKAIEVQLFIFTKRCKLFNRC